jgi:hypothetical protein
MTQGVIMHRRRLVFVALLILAVAACTHVPSTRLLAQASRTAALINQQLDKQVNFDLSASLPEVLTQIGKQTGVPIEAQPQVWDLLPWGRETTVTAKIQNQTLREALQVITKRLGLTFVLKDEAVELQPMPPLRRLGRKSTRSELEAIFLLSETKLGLNADRPKFSELVEAIDAKLNATKPDYAIYNRSATSPDVVPQDAPVSVPRNATLLEALEAIATQTPATWYPWGERDQTSIVILAKRDQTRRLLEKEVTLRHEGTDVAQVLAELSSRCGVPFRYEPGAIQSLPPQTRGIRLVLSGASAIDALEAIAGATGLGYVVKDDNVYIWNTAAQQGAAAPRDRALAWIPTDSGLQIVITESQCPPDIREFIEAQKKKNFDALRKMMAEQGFKPTTQPAATAPSANPGKPGKATEPAGKDL